MPVKTKPKVLIDFENNFVLRYNTWKTFEMWCWRRMEIILTYHLSYEEVLQTEKDERNILQTIKEEN